MEVHGFLEQSLAIGSGIISTNILGITQTILRLIDSSSIFPHHIPILCCTASLTAGWQTREARAEPGRLGLHKDLALGICRWHQVLWWQQRLPWTFLGCE